MIRKIICYSSFLIEISLIGYIIYSFINKIINNLLIVLIIASIVNIIIVIFSILLFGAPNNNPYDYFFKNISYHELKKDKNIIVRLNEEGLWEYNHLYKKYLFNLKGWPNIKKRITDLIFIQYHNDYCNKNKVKNFKYYKNYFKKYNLKMVFIKNNKQKIKKFKPSIILKIKMIIACSHWTNQKYQGNESWERDLWDTFLIIKYYKKNKK